MVEVAPSIEAATKALASVCDHAHERDGVGFDASDTWLGHALAALPAGLWTDADRYAAWKMLAKYTGQLTSMGIDYTAIPEPSHVPKARQTSRNQERARRAAANKKAKERAKAERAAKRAAQKRWDARVTIRTHPTGFKIGFGYDDALVAACREIPGRQWDGSTNVIPSDSAPWVNAFVFCVIAAQHLTDVDSVASAALAGAGWPPPPPSRHETHTVTLHEDTIYVRFPYDRDLVKSVKAVPGRRWNGPTNTNTFPVSSLTDVLAWADSNDFGVSDDLRTLAATQTEMADDLVAISAATDADLNLPFLPFPLRPYQRVAVAYALAARRCWIADEPGLGKTYESLTAVEAADQYPAIIVSPATVKTNWQREAHTLLPHRTVTVLSGRTPDAARTDADIIILNAEILSDWVNDLPSPRSLIVDEAHLLANPDTQRSAAVATLAEDIRTAGDDGLILLLTGTPVPARTRNLIHPLNVLGRLGMFGGESHFLFHFCGATQEESGFWNFDGSDNEEELNRLLRSTCYIRRRKSDVLTELPPKQRQTLYINPAPDLDVAYRNAESDLVGHLTTSRLETEASEAGYDDLDDYLSDSAAMDVFAGNGISRADRVARELSAAVQKAPGLVRTNTLRMLAAAAKIPAAVDWAETFVESTNRKLVVFAHHRVVVDTIADALGAPRIHGSISLAERQEAIDSFQNDPDTRFIVLALASAGVGITLTAAQDLLFIEQAWNPGENDQAEDRCHRFGQTGAVTATYLMLPDSIDEDIAGIVSEKRELIDAVVDGTPIPATSSADVRERLLRRIQGPTVPAT